MYAIHLAQKAKELKREKRKSDSLLFQMLPPSVAMQLKQTQQVSTTYEKYTKGLQEYCEQCNSLFKHDGNLAFLGNSRYRCHMNFPQTNFDSFYIRYMELWYIIL